VAPQCSSPVMRSHSVDSLPNVKQRTSLRVRNDVRLNAQVEPVLSPALSRDQRGNFVKAVNTVKALSHVSAEDAFSAFFPENICQKRAIFMLVQIKKQILIPSLSHTHPSAIIPILSTIGDRLFTYFYAVRVLEQEDLQRASILEEARCLLSQSTLLIRSNGAHEAAYSVYYALLHHRRQFRYSSQLITEMLDKARAIIHSCLDRESKLSPSERESMYIFQQVMANTQYNPPKLLISK